jgi:DedD protein
MPTSSQDTEITLGTGRMLALFFTFVLVCAVFFAIGFSLGRRTSLLGVSNGLTSSPGTPATVVHPSAGKDVAPKAAPQSTDFSFYKAVGSNSPNAEPAPAPQDSKAQPAATQASASPTPPASVANTTPPTGGFFVQVAAVSRQEDAESLVEALKKKQYPAFAANNSSTDKYYHVQVGPYADFKDADAMRSRLIADGYNPIVKK